MYDVCPTKKLNNSRIAADRELFACISHNRHPLHAKAAESLASRESPGNACHEIAILCEDYERMAVRTLARGEILDVPFHAAGVRPKSFGHMENAQRAYDEFLRA